MSMGEATLDDEDADMIMPEPICMYCGRLCETTEVIHTGDEETYKGFECWCYCEHCKKDTFHKIKIKDGTRER